MFILGPQLSRRGLVWYRAGLIITKQFVYSWLVLVNTKVFFVIGSTFGDNFNIFYCIPVFVLCGFSFLCNIDLFI